MRILLVDSDSASRSVIESWLDEFFAHVEIDTACSGADALARLETFRADLVIAAYPMPAASGIELAAILKSWPNPPLVVVIAGSSADADFCVERRHLQARLLDFLQQRFPSAWALGVAARRDASRMCHTVRR